MGINLLIPFFAFSQNLNIPLNQSFSVELERNMNAIEELKKGKKEFKANKTAVIDVAVGKLSFSKKQLVENIRALISEIVKVKPPAS